MCRVMWAMLLCGCFIFPSCDEPEKVDPIDGGTLFGDPNPEETEEETFAIEDGEMLFDCVEDCESLYDGEHYGTEALQLACAMGVCGEYLLDASIEAPLPLLGEDPKTAEAYPDCTRDKMAMSLRVDDVLNVDIDGMSGKTYAHLSNAPIGLRGEDFFGDYERCDYGREFNPNRLANEELEGLPIMHDIVELKLSLKAPEDARGFKVRYAFMGSKKGKYGHSAPIANDKFYLFYQKPGAYYSDRELINLKECKTPEHFWTAECEEDSMDCEKGEKLCAVSTFDVFGACCFLDCDAGSEDDYADDQDDLNCATDVTAGHGLLVKSSGWLETSSTVEPGEEFDLIFHIHDSGDWYGTSSVLIDAFRFTTTGENYTEEYQF